MGRRALLLCLALAGCPRRAPPRGGDAAITATADVPALHVCYGAGGAAVEVPRTTPCASLGASELRPATVPEAPRARRTPAAPDAVTLF